VIARHNNKPAVALGIIKQSTANPLDVSHAVQKAMTQINALMPQGVKLSVAYDSTVFIEASIKSVYRTIIEAIGFVALVILVFLRSVRAAFIPLITIPISLMGALALMLALGFSINTLTLLAFVLAIGLVVDDAIVMLENISRHIDEGMKPMQAALHGSKEIGFAVVAMTLTLAAVFAPIGLAEGRTGKLFTEFALALAGAVLVSGFIALTLTPMLCAKLLKPATKPHVEPAYVGWYREKLTAALAKPRPTVKNAGLSFAVTLILVFGGATLFNAVTFGAFTQSVTNFQQLMAGFKQMVSGELQGPPPPAVMKILESNSPTIPLYFITAKPMNLLLSGLPRELSPTEDRGFFVGVGFAPEGSTIGHVARYSNMIEQIYIPIPERHMHFMVNGVPVVNQMLSFVVMKDWSERERSVRDITAEVGPKMFGVPGLLAFAANPPSLGQDFLDAPVTFILQTTGSWDELNTVTQALIGKASTNPGLQSLRGDLDLNKPELRVRLNRDKVAAVGADVAEVGRTLELMLGGRQITRFKRDGEQYDVILQLEATERREPADLTGIFVRNRTGEMIQLTNLVDVAETVTPKELNHFNKLRAATITATLAPGYSLGEALTYLERSLTELNVPSVSADYGAGSREFKQSSGTIVFVFILALVFIFLVLAAQFESFIDPLIILFTVPLAAFGALVALAFTGTGASLPLLLGGLLAAGLLITLGRILPRNIERPWLYRLAQIGRVVLFVLAAGVIMSLLNTNSLNIYSQIGLIALVGLIAKNGILIVEFANQLQERGADKLTAITEAATQRLRPIIMTSLATVMGAVPLALAAGAGAEARQTIGWVIVGGMSIGTLFTLFVIPVMYMALSRTRPSHSAT
jgi:multidrug efflux pump